MRPTTIRFYTLLKWSFIVSLFTAMTVILTSPDIRNRNSLLVVGGIPLPVHNPLKPPAENWRNFSKAQIDSLSNLGRYLFLDKPIPIIDPKNISKTYKIITWKVGKFLERRHFYHFSAQKFDPFEKCSVRNCEISYNEDEIPQADAVLIHLQKLKGVQDLPKENGLRPENQRWVFLTDENPIFTFMTPGVKIQDFNGKFNWSMTYRIESDVPVPYGRTLLKNPNFYNSINSRLDNEVDNDVLINKKQDVLIAVMGSNCGGKNHRWEYVKELQNYIKVDFYGKCGTLKCPGHFSRDCDAINDYKFYLSFENSNCAQYITEKVWWNAYAKNAIPIVMGAAKMDFQQLLPPNSYINIEDFARPVDLARYILYVNKTYDIYQSYFEWKKYYQVSNEHGYFQTNSYHYCRLCEALNYNSKEKKVYSNLTQFWTKNDCYSRWDE